MAKKVTVVGAGFFGAVCARELSDSGFACLVVERRSHIGGNAYTRPIAEAGCHEHVYGPHIFHTDREEVWRYINRFATFAPFVNRPKVHYRGRLLSFPINLMTLHQLFGVNTPAEAEKYLEGARVPIENPKNLEEFCLSEIGPELYGIFIKGYTAKQWGMSPALLPASLIKRLPVRTTFDDNYFFHPFQGIPHEGYTALFDKLLHGVEVWTGVDFLAEREEFLQRFDHVIFTGPVDEYFGYEKGPLAYRSLRFEPELLPVPDFQGNAIVNYTEEEVPFTRIIEHKHFSKTGDKNNTLITREYPAPWKPGADPFYPVDTPESRALYGVYRQMAGKLAPRVFFGGRLGEFKYYDMDQAVASALTLAETIKKL